MDLMLADNCKDNSLLQLIHRKRGSKRHGSSAVLFELEKMAENFKCFAKMKTCPN